MKKSPLWHKRARRLRRVAQAMQHPGPRFEDIAYLALPWLRPKTTNTSTFGVHELTDIFRRTDVLSPLWIRLNHGQQMAQYQQATRTCRTARDSNFWKTADEEMWQKDKMAWEVIFPTQERLPARRPCHFGQPFQLPFARPWLHRPLPPNTWALEHGVATSASKRRRCILAEALRAHTLRTPNESHPDTATSA